MSFLSASAARAAVCVIALSGAGLWALHAMDAKADPPPMDDSSPCAEGRALFAAKLAYLEARISPEPSQVDAWRSFENAMRFSASELDRACVEEPPRPPSVDAGERLQRMERHAVRLCRRPYCLSHAAMAVSFSMAKYRSSASAGGMKPMGSRSRRLLNQSTHSRVANSTASKLRHGPRRWMTSAL